MSENRNPQMSTDLVVADMDKNLAIAVKVYLFFLFLDIQEDVDDLPRTSGLKAPNLELIGHKVND